MYIRITSIDAVIPHQCWDICNSNHFQLTLVVTQTATVTLPVLVHELTFSFNFPNYSALKCHF